MRRGGAVAARVTLIIEEGPLAGRAFEFDDRDVFLFGRESDCHACAEDDRYLSRHHFALEVAPPLVLLRDLRSHNGTLVNGRRIGGRAQRRVAVGQEPLEVVLHDGDEVRAGRSSLRVRVEGSTAAALPHPLDVGASSRDTDTFGDGRGATIAGFELIDELGHGASGATWLARRAADGAAVALKVVHVSPYATAVTRTRVMREIDLMRTLDHPNVLRLLDAGKIGDSYFLALEHCPEGSADDLLARRTRLPWEEARGIACGILEGLAYAHRRGIVHRDVKPANVLLVASADGLAAKVADFGLAKLIDAAGTPSGVTLTGSSAGTPDYMPREQLLSFRTLRPASDVWSAGATIYRMLAGRPPREHRPGHDALQVVLEGRIVPIATRLPDLRSDVASVIDRSLAPRPEGRYPTAAEMLDALSAAR